MAVIARFDMTASGSGAAGGDIPQDASLRAAQICVESMAVPADDLCQFQRRTLERGHQVTGGLSIAVGWAVGWG
jgi:hypothetical protein